MKVNVADNVPMEFFIRLLTDHGLRVTADKDGIHVKMPPKWAPAKWPVCSACSAPAPFTNSGRLYCAEHYPR